jgi:Pyridoxamine 5'-phosphate oxidase
MYGQISDLPRVEWEWVRSRLVDAPTYWVAASATAGTPHPRPVWGVWTDDDRLALSIGTPTTRRRLAADPRLAVHLDSGIDVVIVDGVVEGSDDGSGDSAVVAYDAKYDWAYDVEQYGPLTVVAPDVVVAWRSEGPAGRDGFSAASRWRCV